MLLLLSIFIIVLVLLALYFITGCVDAGDFLDMLLRGFVKCAPYINIIVCIGFFYYFYTQRNQIKAIADTPFGEIKFKDVSPYLCLGWLWWYFSNILDKVAKEKLDS